MKKSGMKNGCSCKSQLINRVCFEGAPSVGRLKLPLLFVTSSTPQTTASLSVPAEWNGHKPWHTLISLSCHVVKYAIAERVVTW